MSDSPELLKPNTVTDKELQIEAGNLKEENEKLKQVHERTTRRYIELLTASAKKVEELQSALGNSEQELVELRSQLATGQTQFNELREELDNAEELRGDLQAELADRDKEIAELRSELADLRKTSPARELPDALTILSQLRGKRKKTTVTAADVDAILEILEKS